jgi:hypothetical protein
MHKNISLNIFYDKNGKVELIIVDGKTLMLIGEIREIKTNSYYSNKCKMDINEVSRKI